MRITLAVPRSYSFSSPQVINAGQLLGSHSVTFQTPWKLSDDDMHLIMDLSEEGRSSPEIGVMFGESGSYIRHLRSNIRRKKVQKTKTSYPYIEDGYLRFPNERKPGIPNITCCPKCGLGKMIPHRPLAQIKGALFEDTS